MKITSYMGKVKIPCKKCHSLIEVRINEKITRCPYCHAKL